LPRQPANASASSTIRLKFFNTFIYLTSFCFLSSPVPVGYY
jgi:hypothetical protein